MQKFVEESKNMEIESEFSEKIPIKIRLKNSK